MGDDATIEKVGPPEKVIDAFGPELVGQNVEGQVTDMKVGEYEGRTYYFYELKVPHVLITATAAGSRLYLMTVSGNGMSFPFVLNLLCSGFNFKRVVCIHILYFGHVLTHL